MGGRPSQCRIDGEGRECSRCHLYKLWEDFSPSTAKQPGGRSSSCKSCRNVKAQEFRDSDRDGYRQYRHMVTTKFGITPGQYQWLFEQQSGKCALCLNPETKCVYRTGRVWALSVDHDHSCHSQRNKGCPRCIRGLLCATCNVMLGLAEKAGGVVLLRFQDYLEQRPFLPYLGRELPSVEGGGEVRG